MSFDQKILDRLKKVVGDDYCSDADFVVQAYSKSQDPVSPRKAPAVVVLPESGEEVSEIMKIANEAKIPVMPRGVGSDLAAGVRVMKDGVILLDLSKRMNKILKVDTDRMVAIVQPGVQWGELDFALQSQGLFLGQMGPANAAGTIGGGVSNVSVGGGGEMMYGCPGSNCVSMEVVLPTGEIIHTGSDSSKYSTAWFAGRNLGGPDLTGMFVGDPGILGIKTRLAMKIYQPPEFWAVKTYWVPGDNREQGTEKEPICLYQDLITMANIFKDWEKIGNPGINGGGYFNATAFNFHAESEFYEAWTRAVEPGKPNRNGALCIAYCATSQEELDRKVALSEEVCEKHGCQVFGDSIEEGNHTAWMAMHQGGYSAGNWWWGSEGGPGTALFVMDLEWAVFDDVIKKLHDFYEERIADFQAAKMPPLAFMGVPLGGGAKMTIGAVLPDEAPEALEMKIREDLLREEIKIAIANGAMSPWTGVWYSQIMVEEGMYEDSYLQFLKRIKDSLDPNGILSPGKFHFND